MKIEVGDKFEVLNPNVLHGYYDAVFEPGDILEVQTAKLPKVTKKKDSTSYYFAILGIKGKKTKRNDEYRFSVSLDEINTKNFKRVK